MTIEAKETVEGLAPIPGSAIATLATGSRILCLSGQTGQVADGSVAGDDFPLTATTLIGVAALFEPDYRIEIDVTAVVD